MDTLLDQDKDNQDRQDDLDSRISPAAQAGIKQIIKDDQDTRGRKLSYYDEMKRTNPNKYNTRDTRLAMDRDSQALGVAFFDVD